MAIYRPPRRRFSLRWVLVGVGVVAAIVLFLLARDGGPTAAERRATLRVALVEAEGLLEIVEIEYSEAVENGRVVARSEYEGAVDALARSESRYRIGRSLIAPEMADDIDALYAEAGDLVVDRVPETTLANHLKELGRALTRSAG